MFRKSEINLLKKIVLFLFGLSNIFPSQISIYDQYVIPLIQEITTTDNIFYSHITLLIIIFRILIIMATVYEVYDIIKYANRNKIFQ